MFRIKGYEFEIDYTNQTFPDGTLNLNGIDITGCTRIEWYYDNDAELFTLICLAKKCAEHSCSPILYMPYVPNARMDRVKKESDTKNSYLVAFGGHLFQICGYLVREIKDYYAIGAGAPYALTALHLGHDPEEAVKVSCDMCCFVCEPIVTYIQEKDN